MTPARPIPAAAALRATTRHPLGHRTRALERLVGVVLLACGALSIATTVTIVVVLLRESLPFFASGDVSLIAFLTGTEWKPTLGRFGVLPLVSATLVVTGIALFVALPVGLATALYLSEYASNRVRSTIKPTLEILAGIPTVVYGYFALTLITPMLRAILGPGVVAIYNTAAAGIAVGIVIVPLVASLSEEALRAVPRALREAAYAVGATRLETSLSVVVPAALSGIAAAAILAASRAIGETMIVALAAGAGPLLTLDPFQSAETITGHIVRISGGDLSYGSLQYRSLFGLALVLFVLTIGLNLLSDRVVARYREVYE